MSDTNTQSDTSQKRGRGRPKGSKNKKPEEKIQKILVYQKRVIKNMTDEEWREYRRLNNQRYEERKKKKIEQLKQDSEKLKEIKSQLSLS